MPGKIDYWNVKVPDKDRSEFTYAERRAELLEMAKEKGHPDLLPKSDLADDYGVSPAMITKDLNAIADYISNNIGEKSDFMSEILYKKATKELVDEGKWSEARRFIESWQDWAERRGVKERAPDKHEVDQDVSINIVPYEDE